MIVCGASPTMARGLNHREDYWFFDTMIRFHQQIMIVIAQLTQRMMMATERASVSARVMDDLSPSTIAAPATHSPAG